MSKLNEDHILPPLCYCRFNLFLFACWCSSNGESLCTERHGSFKFHSSQIGEEFSDMVVSVRINPSDSGIVAIDGSIFLTKIV